MATTVVGAGGARNMAADWRYWCKCVFWIFVVQFPLPIIGGCFGCLGEKGFAGVAVGFGCWFIMLLIRAGYFWWGVFLRLMEQGSVAAGKMINEC